MLPALYNLPDAYRGDSYGPFSISFFDSAQQPIDVSAATVNCQVGTIGENRTIVLKWPDTTHGVSLSGNTITLGAVSGEYMKMPPEIYFYDLQLIIDGYTKTYLRGNITVLDEITYY